MRFVFIYWPIWPYMAIWFEEIFFQDPAELWRTKFWNRISHLNVWWCLDVQWTLSTLLDVINDWADHKQYQIALNFPWRKKSGMPDSIMIQNGKFVTNVPAIPSAQSVSTQVSHVFISRWVSHHRFESDSSIKHLVFQRRWEVCYKCPSDHNKDDNYSHPVHFWLTWD